MARAVISDDKKQLFRRVFIKNARIAKVLPAKNNSASFQSVLPFRVRFTTIGIESYSPNMAAPIGIAVIGLNNYVM